MTKQNKTFRLTIRAILTAIIMIQAMIPFLGFIPLGVISLTIIHITVIVGSIVLGVGDGMFIGLVWGICTMIRAYVSPSTPIDTLVFTNPLVSVIPRILVGLIAGVTFRFLYKKSKKVALSAVFSSVLGTLTNTMLVLFMMGALYTSQVANMYQVVPSALAKTLGALVIVNGIPEMIVAAIITPLIVKALFSATSLQPPK